MRNSRKIEYKINELSNIFESQLKLIYGTIAINKSDEIDQVINTKTKFQNKAKFVAVFIKLRKFQKTILRNYFFQVKYQLNS
jgi:hypothetical protein